MVSLEASVTGVDLREKTYKTRHDDRGIMVLKKGHMHRSLRYDQHTAEHPYQGPEGHNHIAEWLGRRGLSVTKEARDRPRQVSPRRGRKNGIYIGIDIHMETGEVDVFKLGRRPGGLGKRLLDCHDDHPWPRQTHLFLWSVSTRSSTTSVVMKRSVASGYEPEERTRTGGCLCMPAQS